MTSSLSLLGAAAATGSGHLVRRALDMLQQQLSQRGCRGWQRVITRRLLGGSGAAEATGHCVGRPLRHALAMLQQQLVSRAGLVAAWHSLCFPLSCQLLPPLGFVIRHALGHWQRALALLTGPWRRGTGPPGCSCCPGCECFARTVACQGVGVRASSGSPGPLAVLYVAAVCSSALPAAVGGPAQRLRWCHADSNAVLC